MQGENEITGTEDMIGLDEVTARIRYLEARDCREPERDDSDYPCANGSECPTCDDEAKYELAELRGLQWTLGGLARLAGRATAIRDSYMTEFVQDEADDIAGIGQGSYLFSYVKWDELAGDRTMDMTATRFRGTGYWVTA